MSEQNIENILNDIEEIYRKQKRHGATAALYVKSGGIPKVRFVDVTCTLTSLIIETISSQSILHDNFVVTYAALVSGLHKIVGIDFGELIQIHLRSLFKHSLLFGSRPFRTAQRLKVSESLSLCSGYSRR